YSYLLLFELDHAFNVSVFYQYAANRYLHSFPTRRSSDLFARRPSSDGRGRTSTSASSRPACRPRRRPGNPTRSPARGRPSRVSRSEEHTSELQSRSDLVCRLLLEKKIAHVSMAAICGCR